MMMAKIYDDGSDDYDNNDGGDDIDHDHDHDNVW